MNSQQIIATFEEMTGQQAKFKNGRLKKKVLQYNLKLLKEGKTEIYLDRLKYYNPLTQRLNNHKLKKNTLVPTPTKPSLDRAKKLIDEAKFDYVSKNGELVKIPESVKRNPIPYLEQKFDKSFSSLQNLKNKNFKLLKEIPSNKKLNLILKISFDLYYNGTYQKTMKFNKEVSASASELSNDELIKSFIEDYFGQELDGDLTVANIIVDYFTQKSGQQLKLENMKLFLGNPLKISNLYNEVIDKNYKDCVYDYLMDIWGKKLSNKQKIMLNDKRTINELYEFCCKYDIKLLAYDIAGNIIKSYYPTKKQKKFKNLCFIAYNEHLYPLKNTALHKTYIEDKDLILNNTTNIHDKFIDYLKEAKLPKVVKLSSDGLVQAFIEDGTIYFENKEFNECKKILSSLGFEDKLSWRTTFNNIANIIEPFYLNGNHIDSYWTNSKDFVKGGFTYLSEQGNELLNEEYITIDKNKAYSNALLNLPFLIQVDFKTDEIYKYEGNVIQEHYLYVVSVKKSNILLPNTNIYSGHHINKCIENGLKLGVDFKILEFIETTRHENYYKQMVIDIYEKVKDQKIAKSIINIFIGKMERYNNVNEFISLSKVINDEEMKTYEGNYHKIGCINNKNYYICLDTKSVANVTNKKPIAIQIKDQARFTLFDFMKNNNIANNDVLQVKTDSITFKKTNDKYKEYLSNDLDGWKLENYKELISSRQYNKPELQLNYRNRELVKLKNKCPYKSVSMICGYAGNGKTYFVKNKLIERIKKDNEKYLILTPSHDSSNEYRKDNLNCKVIQGYSFRGQIPDEKHIIVDEIGMVSSSDWLIIIKCILLGKYVYCFGDFNQLPPVKSKCITQNFINSLFDNLVWFGENYRNNFNTDYYKKLIKTKDTKFLEDEVAKVCEKTWSKDCMVVSYTNKKRHEFNRKICKKLNVPYIEVNDKDGNLKRVKIHPDVPIGTEIICNSNILGSKKIYNKFVYKITKKYEFEGSIMFEIDSGTSSHKVPYASIERYFDYTFCRTLYSIQGKSIEKINFIDKYHWINDNQRAYTFISRKKEKVDLTNKKEYKLTF